MTTQNNRPALSLSTARDLDRVGLLDLIKAASHSPDKLPAAALRSFARHAEAALQLIQAADAHEAAAEESKPATIEEALAHPEAALLVHGKPSCDRNGNSRARQAVYSSTHSGGRVLFEDGRIRSYWYCTENDRRAFERRGGVVISR